MASAAVSSTKAAEQRISAAAAGGTQSVSLGATTLLHVPSDAKKDGRVLQTGPCDWLFSLAMSLAMNWIFVKPAVLAPDADFIPAKKVAAALERLLQHYPWLAGRFTTGECGRIQVNGTDEGVPFVVAETGCRISDLPLSVEQYTNTRLLPEALKLVADLDPSKAIDAPPLQVQHTRFACGGIALGVRISHILADGEALFTFMRHWSELYESGAGELKEPPSLDRTWTIPTEEEVARRLQDHKEQVLTTEPPAAPSAESGNASPRSPGILSVFRFSRAQLQHLKQSAEAGVAKGSASISTYQALCAWLLQRMYRARVACGQVSDSEADLDRSVKFVFAVNWRCRMRDPPAPPHYFGNGAVQLAMIAPMRALLHDSLPVLANRLHEAVSAATSDRVKSTLAWITSNSAAGRSIRWDIDFHCDMASTEWTKLGMYKLTFDGVAPLRICLPHFPGFDGSIMLHSTPAAQPGTESDGIDVYVGLSEAATDKLTADHEWRRLRDMRAQSER
jgi:hypothetical protein